MSCCGVCCCRGSVGFSVTLVVLYDFDGEFILCLMVIVLLVMIILFCWDMLSFFLCCGMFLGFV